jgi:hypothetical protein
MSEYLFCCLSPQQQEEIRLALANKSYGTVYRHQENLQKEKTGYRCTGCGAFYPFLQIEDGDELKAPEAFSRPAGKQTKYKKAAGIFCGDHYYAQSKKMLLRFELDTARNAQPTDAIPLMGDVYHIAASPDEQYIATETIKGTIAVIDTHTKEVIAQKRRCSLNGKFAFAQDHTLVYFLDNAIRCWDFFADQEQVVWTEPDTWKGRTVCSGVIFCASEQKHIVQLRAEDSTYLVVLKETIPEQVVQLPMVPVWRELVYHAQRHQYTLVSGECVTVYDDRFHVIETFAYPTLTQISDGGGFFPVSCFAQQEPHRAMLSPDGQWVLLDYFTEVILLKRPDNEIRFCLFSYTGKTAKNMGFLDNRRFWYTWGDTTYIQELPG